MDLIEKRKVAFVDWQFYGYSFQLKNRPWENFMETVQNDITPNMRGILVDWLVEVCGHSHPVFNFSTKLILISTILWSMQCVYMFKYPTHNYFYVSRLARSISLSLTRYTWQYLTSIAICPQIQLVGTNCNFWESLAC